MFDGLNWLWSIVVGGVAGWLADLVVPGVKVGILGAIIAGILGGFLGGWLFSLLGLGTTNIIGILISAVVGAIYRFVDLSRHRKKVTSRQRRVGSLFEPTISHLMPNYHRIFAK